MAIVEQEPKNLTQILPCEIECPRCNQSMQLRSDFDTPFYSCEECDFILDPCKKGWSSLACRNLCERIGVRGSNKSLYNMGMNYCQKCEVFFHTGGATHCFCCGKRLRFKSRKRRFVGNPEKTTWNSDRRHGKHEWIISFSNLASSIIGKVLWL